MGDLMDRINADREQRHRHAMQRRRDIHAMNDSVIVMTREDFEGCRSVSAMNDSIVVIVPSGSSEAMGHQFAAALAAALAVKR